MHRPAVVLGAGEGCHLGIHVAAAQNGVGAEALRQRRLVVVAGQHRQVALGLDEPHRLRHEQADDTGADHQNVVAALRWPAQDGVESHRRRFNQ